MLLQVISMMMMMAPAIGNQCHASLDTCQLWWQPGWQVAWPIVTIIVNITVTIVVIINVTIVVIINVIGAVMTSSPSLSRPLPYHFCLPHYLRAVQKKRKSCNITVLIFGVGANFRRFNAKFGHFMPFFANSTRFRRIFCAIGKNALLFILFTCIYNSEKWLSKLNP